MMPRVFLWPAVVLWEGPPRRQRICATLLLALAMSPIYAGGQVATGEASLSADARPSRVRVLGGELPGWLGLFRWSRPRGVCSHRRYDRLL